MKAFVRFMGSAAGRLLRIVTGGGVIAWGLLGIGGSDGNLVAAIGALPVLTGLLNICVVGPLFGAPLSGAKARAVGS